MSNRKISQLPPVTAITSGDTFVFVQNGITVRGTFNQIVNGVTGTTGTDTNTYVTGITNSNNNIIIRRNDGATLSTNINSLTGLTINGTISASTYAGITHQFGTNVLFVDPTGSDETGNGSEWNPYKQIRKALTGATDNAVIIIRPGTYIESRTRFSTEVSGNNITLYGMPGVVVGGADSLTIPTTVPFNTKFLYYVDAAKTFNITGHMKHSFSEGFLSCDNTGALANVILDAFQQTGATSMNIRIKQGHANFVINNGDLIVSDMQGIFIGPGDASMNLTVKNGDFIAKKISTTTLDDQTRAFQLRNASTTRKSVIRANNYRVEYNSNLNFTNAWDPIYLESPNSTFEFYGNIVDGQVGADGIINKAIGDDGCIQLYSGNLKLFGSISAVTTNGITTVGSDQYKVEVFGDVSSDRKYAILDNNSNSASKLIVHGKMTSNGIYPTIKKTSSSKLFIDGPVINTTSNPNSIGIDYTGSNLIFTRNAGFDVQAAYPISTNVTGLSYKLMNNIPSTKAFPSLSAGTSNRVSVNTVRDNQIYTLNVKGTDYNYTSVASSTNITIANGLHSLISGLTDVIVVNNANGTLDITDKAGGTTLSVSDSTSWFTNAKWEIDTSFSNTTYGITVDAVTSSYTTSAGYFYFSGGLSTIVNAVYSGVTGSSLNTYTTTTGNTYGFYIASNSTTVMTACTAVGDTHVYRLNNPLVITTLDYGYVGDLTNLISGTTIISDTDVEFF